MTVSTTKTSKAHEPNGTATVFGFDFPVLDASYLVVTHTVGSEVTTLLLDRDYTVQGVGEDTGGSITTTETLTGGTLLLRRQTPILQETLLRNQSKFHAETHEAALDRLTMIQQELLVAEGGAIQGQPGPPGTNGKDATAHETTKDLVLSSDHGSVDLGLLSQFQRITFSAPGRLRIYVSEAARVADVTRNLGTDPVSGAGCLLEVNPNPTDGLGGSLTPLFTAAPEKGGDGLCYWTWAGALGTTCSLEYYNGTIAGTTIIPQDGATVHQEARAPLQTDGISGESWIDNTTWDVYHKEAGSWILTGNIKGLKGDPGKDGVDGAAVAHATSHAPGGADALPWTEIHGRGPTAQRPAAAAGNAGYTWFDTTLQKSQRSNGTAWEDCEGAGGGDGGGAVTDVSFDAPPANPSPYNDEFNGPALDSAWAWANPPQSAEEVKFGSLHVIPNAPDAQTHYLYRTAPTATVWYAVAKIRISAPVLANYYLGGVAVGNSANSNIIECGWAWANGGVAYNHIYNSPTSRRSYRDSTNNFGLYGLPYYVKIARNGDALSLSISNTGHRWTAVSAHSIASDLGGALDRIGLSFSQGPTSPSPSVLVDWFRVFSE